MRGRDVERDVFDETTEIFVFRDEIGFAIHFHQNADLALQMNVRSNDAFLGRTRRLLTRTRDPFGSQNRLCFRKISLCLGQGAFAVHHARVCFFAELFN